MPADKCPGCGLTVDPHAHMGRLHHVILDLQTKVDQLEHQLIWLRVKPATKQTLVDRLRNRR